MTADKLKNQITEVYKWINPEADKVTFAYIDTGFSSAKHNLEQVDIELIRMDSENSAEEAYSHGSLFLEIVLTYLQALIGKIKILAYKAGSGTRVKTSCVIESLQDAINREADVISINVSNLYYHPQLARLLHEACLKGILVIAPAGNFIRDKYTFPASYNTVIGLTSVAAGGQLSEYANVTECTDLAAPEENIMPYLEQDEGFRNYLQEAGAENNKGILEKMIKHNFFGTSSALPFGAILLLLAKLMHKRINITGFKNILASAALVRLPYTFNGRSGEVGLIDFEAVLNPLKNPVHDHAVALAEQSFFYFTPHDSRSIHVEIYDQAGNPDKKTRHLEVRILAGDNTPAAAAQDLLCSDGHMVYEYGSPGKGEFILEFLDRESQILKGIVYIDNE